MLNLTKLSSNLQLFAPEWRGFLFDTLPSTNLFIKEYFKSHPLQKSVCVALSQTSGYGQQQRSWHNASDSWLFSCVLPINLPVHKLSGLSSSIGLSVLKSLQDYVVEPLSIKWPNDLWTDKGKCSGILIEVLQAQANQTWLVVGIGINFGSFNQASMGDDYPFSALTFKDGAQESHFCALLCALENTVTAFENKGFEQFLEAYKKYDKFRKGQSVIVYDSHSKIHAKYLGLNALGELKVEIDGELKVYQSGRVSVRPN